MAKGLTKKAIKIIDKMLKMSDAELQAKFRKYLEENRWYPRLYKNQKEYQDDLRTN